MNDDDDKDRAPDSDATLERAIAKSFARKGEIPPTTEDEVLRAEDEGVAFEGALPASLRTPRAGRVSTSPAAAGAASIGAASQRVVALDELRQRKRGTPVIGYVATFALGAAAAAALLLGARGGDRPGPRHDPAAGSPSGAPSASSSASTTPAPVAVPPAFATCGDGCCAGSACGTAKGELRKCIGARSCIACSEPSEGSAYRVRLGNLAPAKGLSPEKLRALDLCARVGGAPWSCEPAFVDAASRPAGRVLPGVASAADLAAQVVLELRPRGEKEVLGSWRDSVRVGPTVLCHGVGALVASAKKDDLGSLMIQLDDAYFVEMDRAARTAALLERRAGLSFADVVPKIWETGAAGDGRFALVLGPFDKATAERLRWSLVDRAQPATVVVGGDYVGAPRELAP